MEDLAFWRKKMRKMKLARQDSNLECLDQNQVCYLLHHGPVMRSRVGGLFATGPEQPNCVRGSAFGPSRYLIRGSKNPRRRERPCSRNRAPPAAPPTPQAVRVTDGPGLGT